MRVTVSASQIGSAGFDLASENRGPEGIVFANNRFYVVDWVDDKVYAYQASGQRDSASDFDLDSTTRWPRGIAFANDRFYVVDWPLEKVYAYQATGQRDSASDFDLDSDTRLPCGITFANNRFYVVDGFDDKVYAYQAAGQRDSASDFDLDSANRSAEGITFANNRFYVVDDREGRVYAYDASGQPASAFDLYLDPANGDASGIEFANNRFYVVDDREDRVYAYSAGAAPGTTDSQLSFGTATVSNRTYTAGAAISALTLPAASGGDGTLTYSLSPAVAGLSFNATTRVLSGTPTTVGSYGMTYTARDADGDIATLRFTITVAGSGSFAPADEQSLNRLVVGNRLHAVGFYIDFPSAGRFLESGSLPGSYSYASTGSDTGTMTLTYDGGNFGGSCTLLLTFVSATTGTFSYTCASGITGAKFLDDYRKRRTSIGILRERLRDPLNPGKPAGRHQRRCSCLGGGRRCPELRHRDRDRADPHERRRRLRLRGQESIRRHGWRRGRRRQQRHYRRHDSDRGSGPLMWAAIEYSSESQRRTSDPQMEPAIRHDRTRASAGIPDGNTPWNQRSVERPPHLPWPEHRRDDIRGPGQRDWIPGPCPPNQCRRRLPMVDAGIGDSNG